MEFFNDDDIILMTEAEFARHGLDDMGWTVEIVDTLDGARGYAHQDAKTIQLARDQWPTAHRNIEELVLHEVAHALCGHGEHNLQWWDQLMDLGGRGIWVEHADKIKNIGVTVTY